MRYHQELAARVRQANATQLARLARLYPHNARLQTLVAEALATLPDRPKPLFTPLPRA
jgi:hypothetical protein